ncbi:hypothetical protein MAR_007313 [Mya arenaria]|uniref:Uncharacterized protein n=1 Tax=Mya arenaria TaxID=6604 RepID=A0ABY7DDR6_MYAAR|nr:hypothetical protein MAR_007232 [Mya arenaria]WAQ94842.1 hypothetical protein MAR_007313 [Mya arenaria]
MYLSIVDTEDVEARYGGPPSSTSTSNGDCDIKKKGLICQEKKTSPETSSVSAIATRTSTLNGDYGVQAPAYTEKNFPTDQNISDATQDNGPFIVSYGKS